MFAANLETVLDRFKAQILTLSALVDTFTLLVSHSVHGTTPGKSVCKLVAVPEFSSASGYCGPVHAFAPLLPSRNGRTVVTS